VGVDITAETPQAVTADMIEAADLVITLGREAHVAPVEGTRFENWDTDEPSERGIVPATHRTPAEQFYAHLARIPG
jgi:arsenate-mycothiol transferase